MDFSNIKLLMSNILKEELKPHQKEMVDQWSEENKKRTDGVPDDIHNKMFADHNNGDENATHIVIPFNGRINSDYPLICL